MARGDSGNDERSTGLLLAAILGLMALAATVVVVWVSYEPERPDVAPAASLLFESTLTTWRLCEDTSALTDDALLSDSDRVMRSRGYVPIGDWSEAQAVGTEVQTRDTIAGGCGVVVAARVGSSSVHGHRDGIVEHSSCQSTRWSVATCGAPVTFIGYGDMRTRAYLMPGATPVDGTHAQLLLAQAEAEHLLAGSGFEGEARVMQTTLRAGDRLTVPPPSTGCLRLALAGYGAALDIRSERPAYANDSSFVRAIAVCASDRALEVTAHVGDVDLLIRPFVRGQGGGQTTTVSGATRVSTLADLAPTASP